MLCTIQSGPAAPRTTARDEAPWRDDLEALRTLLQDSRGAGPTRAQIAALIEDEAPGALPRRARERIAERLAAALRG
ncbi:hypothetical protein [Methylobacterium isbiliense]|uniref:Uncharacterized protein n=1 Tax=Methylobacterium isbiliense TaxID=315478 RepID=A0ABQ4SAG5_9HYPH|nr:hypothetical protein [Methylobacterium isbiliense]MDN3622026.1 hypothetical protein [Methylobacterium isbiliense]GJD99460.1 hypothetical protein GMJLKIPL_1377 [Methylobacterium isbiliense]